MNPLRIIFSFLPLAAGMTIAAQSVYPGQHAGKIKVETTASHKVSCFDLKNVRLLPGRVRDNLERDSAWMVSIPVSRLLHSFRNNAGETPTEAITLSMRYPAWSGRPIVKINGRRMNVNGSPSSYISLRRSWHKGDVIEVTYPMSLHVETTPDNSSRGALLYGPIVLAGNLGTEGMCTPAPFSDPTVRNDYYTYDYNIPQGLPTSLAINPAKPERTIRRIAEPLRFRSSEGVDILPLYDAHRCRYVVYWDLKQ